MPMRQFNPKGWRRAASPGDWRAPTWLIPHPANESEHLGRTISPEPMRMAEPGCGGESVMRWQDHVTDEEERAAREWLAHVEAGRIGKTGS